MLGNGFKGFASGYAWYDRQIDLMSGANVYGVIVASLSLYDIETDNR